MKKTVAFFLFACVVTSVQAQEKCSVPMIEKNGSLDVSQSQQKMGARVGTTLKIISLTPPMAELTLHGVKGCGGSFKSVVGESVCEGNVLKLVIDRSTARTSDCQGPVPLHLRVEDGKWFGRYGGPAINSGTDNLQF